MGNITLELTFDQAMNLDKYLLECIVTLNMKKAAALVNMTGIPGTPEYLDLLDKQVAEGEELHKILRKELGLE